MKYSIESHYETLNLAILFNHPIPSENCATIKFEQIHWQGRKKYKIKIEFQVDRKLCTKIKLCIINMILSVGTKHHCVQTCPQNTAQKSLILLTHVLKLFAQASVVQITAFVLYSTEIDPKVAYTEGNVQKGMVILLSEYTMHYLQLNNVVEQSQRKNCEISAMVPLNRIY